MVLVKKKGSVEVNDISIALFIRIEAKMCTTCCVWVDILHRQGRLHILYVVRSFFVATT